MSLADRINIILYFFTQNFEVHDYDVTKFTGKLDYFTFFLKVVMNNSNNF